MGKIKDLNLGGEILAMRNAGMTYRQIEDEIFLRYKQKVSFASIRNWLVSEEGRKAIPRKSNMEQARDIVVKFGADLNKLRIELCPACREKLDRFRDSWIDKMNNDM